MQIRQHDEDPEALPAYQQFPPTTDTQPKQHVQLDRGRFLTVTAFLVSIRLLQLIIAFILVVVPSATVLVHATPPPANFVFIVFVAGITIPLVIIQLLTTIKTPKCRFGPRTALLLDLGVLLVWFVSWIVEKTLYNRNSTCHNTNFATFSERQQCDVMMAWLVLGIMEYVLFLGTTWRSFHLWLQPSTDKAIEVAGLNSAEEDVTPKRF